VRQRELAERIAQHGTNPFRSDVYLVFPIYFGYDLSSEFIRLCVSLANLSFTSFVFLLCLVC
jgi:hypothetical protein